jgi:hypothetical protein
MLPDLVDRLPLVTGSLVFLSVLLVRWNFRASMGLGLVANVLLIVFGIGTAHPEFWMHLLVAGAFTVNLWMSRKKGDRARSRIDSACPDL